MPVTISYKARIVSELSKLTKLANPDSKHNEGSFLGEAFLWDTVADYAAARAKDAWKQMEQEDVIKDDEARHAMQPGEHILSESPRFVLRAVVTQPVKRFDATVLAKKLKEKYRIPEPTTKQFVDESKVPTKSQVRMEISEKGAV